MVLLRGVKFLSALPMLGLFWSFLLQNSSTNKVNDKLAWTLFASSFLLSLFFILFTFVPLGFSARTDNVTGFAWSPGYGFTSFNSCHCNSSTDPGCSLYGQCYDEWPDPPYSYAPYGLNVDFGNKEISGWAWSNSVGYICFGRSCQGHYTNPPPVIPGNISEVKATYDDRGKVWGWAKIVSFKNDLGWLSLRGEIGTATGGKTGEYGLNFSTSTLNIWGLAWSGLTEPTYNLPFRLTNIDNAWGYGWFCVDDNTVGAGSGGLGLCPNMAVKVTVPYLQTIDGDIYVRNNLTSMTLPSGGNYNATYLILAGGDVVNFISEEKYKPSDIKSYVATSYPLLFDLPKSSRNYFNIFGKLDVPGLSQLENNQYGSYVDLSANTGLSGTFSGGGKRYIVDKGYSGNFVLGEGGSLTLTGGSATFIIKGDLYINNNVYYDNTPVSSLSSLPSFAFIVEGDLFIDPSVTEVAGNYVVLGDPAEPACPTSDSAAATGCGTIYTGKTADNYLVVNGILMGRQIFLQRSYSDIDNTPSEKVLYDGRLLLNTPPGFKDLSASLPLFSEARP